MFPTRLLLSTTLIYTYLILVYTLAMSGAHGFFDLGGDAAFLIAANSALISCSGAAGMAIFAFGIRRLPEDVRRHAPLCAVALSAVGHLCLMFVPSLFSLGVVLSILGWGFLTAHILYRVTTEIPAEVFGRFIGVSYGLSAVLQFAIGEADALSPAVPLTRLLALPCLGAFAFFSRGENVPLSSQEALPGWRRSFFLKSRAQLLLGAALLSLLMGFSDSVTIAHYQEFAPAFPASRLFYAAGLFFFGWLADRRFASLPAIVLLTNVYYLWFRGHTNTDLFLLLSEVVEAVYGAPIVILLTVGFLHAAASSDSPERWAAMGRIVGLPLTVLGIVIGLSLWPIVSMTTMLAVYTTLLLVAVVLLYHGTLVYFRALQSAAETQVFSVPVAAELPLAEFPAGSGVPMPEVPPFPSEAVTEEGIAPEDETETISKPAPTDETEADEEASPHDEAEQADAFDAYCRRYGLTAKESEILADILKGKSADAIAEAHFITKRTVRFHISNLLHKTGNKSQIAMIAHFHQTADNGVQSETEEKKSGVV